MDPEFSIIPSMFNKNDSPEARAKKQNALITLVTKKAMGRSLNIMFISSNDNETDKYCKDLCNKLCGDHRVTYSPQDFLWSSTDKTQNTRVALGLAEKMHYTATEIVILMIPEDHISVLMSTIFKDKQAVYSIEYMSAKETPVMDNKAFH